MREPKWTGQKLLEYLQRQSPEDLALPILLEQNHSPKEMSRLSSCSYAPGDTHYPENVWPESPAELVEHGLYEEDELDEVREALIIS